MTTVITLDGPSGSGKSALSVMLSKYFGFDILDSGMIYRLFAHQYICDEIDDVKVLEIANKMPYNYMRFKVVGERVKLFINEKACDEEIYSEYVGTKASKLSKYEIVRKSLLPAQRELKFDAGLIANGRDMGTTVFPDATIKFYITANSDVRAKRRYQQSFKVNPANKKKSVKDLMHLMKERDSLDAKRNVSPLKPAEDAIPIDNSNLDLPETFQVVLAHINENIESSS
ncbi:(d)CMP kinase [Gammaproteobacteria bacterium]|nr:(d)CMP kinase [Gammaproteobacteria bacterium]